VNKFNERVEMSESLKQVSSNGVSIWLDDLSRERLETGTLKQLIEGSYVVGVTTNPAIFSAAFANSDRYNNEVLELHNKGLGRDAIVEKLTTDDVRNACDLFMPIFEATQGADGRVSIEVEPGLAYDTEGTINRAVALHKIVNRPNVLIKVPATADGLPAIEEITARGISVNVTLIFSIERYEQVMDAYMRGLERRMANNLELNSIHSVASFFISRIDSAIDKELPSGSPLRGKTAIANARLAYQSFLSCINSSRWQKLAAAGAQYQRPLWASTGVKDPAYDKSSYVIELIAPHCVNTMPEGTLNEVRSNGVVRGDTISSEFASSEAVLSQLSNAGINLSQVTQHLEDDGVAKFVDAWNELLNNVDAAIARMITGSENK
jgi:transaldolase